MVPFVGYNVGVLDCIFGARAYRRAKGSGRSSQEGKED